MPSGVPLGIPEFLLGVGVLLLLTERSFQGVSGSLKQVCLFYPHPQQLPGWGGACQWMQGFSGGDKEL